MQNLTIVMICENEKIFSIDFNYFVFLCHAYLVRFDNNAQEPNRTDKHAHVDYSHE